MDDPRHPAAPADDGELLSAYLAGELDEPATAALEQRLAADGGLRAQLEVQREVQEALAAIRAPAAPAGAGERLRARLAAERSAEPPADSEPVSERAAGPSEPSSAVTSLDAARARRRPGGISWAAVGGSPRRSSRSRSSASAA
jgi:anti-sigma factor RsiW